MSPKSLVRLSNIIGMVNIILLLYWVFIFVMIQVFDLRVFRKNITEIFYMSIIGILALMIGALIVNIMFNLTRIAEGSHRLENQMIKPKNKIYNWLFLLSFPLIVGLLFGGDYLTSKNKKSLLIKTAESIVKENKARVNQLVDYHFNRKWIEETATTLTLISQTDKHFPYISVIKKDTFETSPVLLHFNNYAELDTTKPSKLRFIRKTTKAERAYFQQVFEQKTDKIRYSSHDGRYELFYPYQKNNKTIVLYFTDYQRYGKIGS